MAALVSLFVSLGLWQWNKGQAKLHIQAERDSRSAGALVAVPAVPGDAETLRHRHVAAVGEYDAARQILIDNRTYNERAGYHVITPLRLSGSEVAVLVNRGWVPAPADHSVVPSVPPPTGIVEVTGVAVVPPERFFTLAAPPASGWQLVWQNLDLPRLKEALPYPVQPVVVQLDPQLSGGYVRDWPRPDERADKHLSYALQWFGFAATSVGIWLYFLLRRPS